MRSIFYNTYSYCENNPITNLDSRGNFVIAGLVIGICAVGGVAAAGVYAYNANKRKNKAMKEIQDVQEKYKNDQRKNEISEDAKHEVLKNNAAILLMKVTI